MQKTNPPKSLKYKRYAQCGNAQQFFSDPETKIYDLLLPQWKQNRQKPN